MKKKKRGVVVFDAYTIVTQSDTCQDFASQMNNLARYNDIVVLCRNEDDRFDVSSVFARFSLRSSAFMITNQLPNEYDYLVSAFSVICFDRPSGLKAAARTISKLSNRRKIK